MRFIASHVRSRRQGRCWQLGSSLLSPIAFGLIGVALALWLAAEQRRVVAAEQRHLTALSSKLARQLAVNLQAIDRALNGVTGAGEGAHLQAARDMHALVDAMPQLRAMMVLDRDGIVIAASHHQLLGGDFSRRSCFTLPRQRGDPGKLYLSAPEAPSAGKVIGVARLLPGRTGQNGVIVALIEHDYFTGMLRSALYAADMQAAISSGRATMLTAGAAVGQHADKLGARAIVDLDGADTIVTLQLVRPLAAVVAPLERQAIAAAAVYIAIALLWAGALDWRGDVRRRRSRDAAGRARERRQASALRASEARFRTLIEEAPVAIAMARHGRFIYTNRRYNLLHGYAATEDLTGLTWSDMIAPACLTGLHQQLTCIDADAAVEQRFEAVGLGNGGALIAVFKATTRVLLGDGAATLIFVQDISAQKSAESYLLEARDAAEAANRSKAQFLANMSHEIRTPLNAILGMAYLLEQGNRDREAAVMLQKIRLAGRSLLGIINDILDVSKIDAGAMVLERSWFSLQEVIDRVAAVMGMVVGEKAIALRVAPLPALATCAMGDALRIEQILVNLTSNAIKFTEKGSVSLTVEASLRADGQATLTFCVSDSGIGISAAQQASIFAPFNQADTSTTRRYGGSGLGLTICKQMVELMGGQIGVDSVPGCGSTFWLTLPLPVRFAIDQRCAADMRELDILLVDAASGGVGETARALGWRVLELADADAVAEELARRCGGRAPDAVILDWHGDEAGSAELARTLRAGLVPLPCPVVAVVSASHTGTGKVAAICALADGLVTPPVTTSTLYDAVRAVRAAHSVTDQGSAAQRPGALSGIRILVVDDSDLNREVAQRILQREGAVVATASDGKAAIDYLRGQDTDEIDLVLMDVQMPVMDGIEATTALRAMARFAELPIIALTAGAFNSQEDAARCAGMDHFIAKPFDVAVTVDLIARIGRRRRQGADGAARHTLAVETCTGADLPACSAVHAAPITRSH